jgi:transcriptional regulator with XRE-family HTH domain
MIRKAREAAKFTQGELAERLGVQLNAVSRWEFHHREPTFADLQHIADATGHRLVVEMRRKR